MSWTEAFPQEFRRRRGYDVLPWLPAKSGLPIGEPAQRQRFERDFALTVGELIAENHYAYQKEVANREGLVSIAEAAGPHQRHGDVRQMQGRCDVAMGEFWMPCAHRHPLEIICGRKNEHGLHESHEFSLLNPLSPCEPKTHKP